MSDDLVTFLLARIGEDEEVALLPAPGDPEWHYDDRTEAQWHTARCGYEMLEMMNPCDCDVRTRVLAECEAKRAIVALHDGWPTLIQTEPKIEVDHGDGFGGITARMLSQIGWVTNREYVARFGVASPVTPMLRILAAVYSDHPDYDPAWR